VPIRRIGKHVKEQNWFVVWLDLKTKHTFARPNVRCWPTPAQEASEIKTWFSSAFWP